MWQQKTVERALFKWNKWRCSIINIWANSDNNLEKLCQEELNKKVSNELSILKLPSSVFLKIYWICSVTSDYNLDYEKSFNNIIVPSWLPIPDNLEPSVFVHVFKKIPYTLTITSGDRLYPPFIISQKDIEFAVSQVEEGYIFGDAYYPTENQDAMILPENHELKLILNTLKGRPGNQGHIGVPPYYSDRLAVKCAALNNSGMKDLKIGEIIEPELDEDKKWSILPKDIVHHLIVRGYSLLDCH